ncbi:hypothetical protein KAU30_04050, partial [Candidatus Bathyarchaeota archaeon]|nr:hypothetical protein [Candidatus Bathyarchaeota archaeon]
MGSQIEDLMDKTIQHALKVGAGFAEVKGEDTVRRDIEAVNKEIRTVSQIRNIGIGVRIFYGKGSGFSFSNVLDEENVFRAVETAMKIARASTKKTLIKLKLASVKTVEAKKSTKVGEHPKDVSLAEKKDLCLRQCKTAMEMSKRIVNTTSAFGEYYGTIYYANSEGTKVSHEPLLIGLRIACVAKKGKTIVDARDSHGGSLGLT